MGKRIEISKDEEDFLKILLSLDPGPLGLTSRHTRLALSLKKKINEAREAS